ncbi:hypothetical protein D9615_008369 [Tricholomella constricta]|uniref:CCHC-type domain-containing protein n=1 Tax=Tricholomella constricta TaxID=117010 RepID=A0A8H5HDK1_9AGAR|nr:hypothetical protein D9615_008369 [Tricholomella constricta]
MVGYPDGRHLVLKFRRGMDPKLSRRLGSITTGRPHDEKIEEWLRIARSQDFIMRSEDDFHRRMVPTKAPDSRPTTAVAARWAFATAPTPIPTPALAPPAPRAPIAPAPRPLPQGVPMDVDRMRDRVAPADDHCFRCKKKGHYSRDCPLHWDMRHMLDDELEALIMERLARKDAVPTDQTPSSADAGASDAEEEYANTPIIAAIPMSEPTDKDVQNPSDPTTPIAVAKPIAPSRRGLPRWEKRLPSRFIAAASPCPRSLWLNAELETTDTQESHAVTALVDSGATGSFLNIAFVEKHKLTTKVLSRPSPVYNVDGTLNEGGSVSCIVEAVLRYNGHTERAVFGVTC